MIHYVATQHHHYTIAGYLKDWGSKFVPRIKPLLYEELHKLKSLPSGTYIFSDIERLSSQQAEIAARVWEQLKRKGKDVHLLNHPTRSMRRYELLRMLHARGINQFNVYWLSELRQPEHFPVFLRNENDHSANRTPLLHSIDELNAAIERLDSQGKSRQNKIITEFCDTSDADGTFRKYTAFMIGDRVIPRSVFFGTKWMLKSAGNTVATAQTLREEQEYMETNPHEDQLREVFRLANIQYGRIDYSMLNGVPQVWEINTNPDGLRLSDADRVEKVSGVPIDRFFAKEFELAFDAIDCKPNSATSVPISVAAKQSMSQTFKHRNEDILVLLFKRVLPLMPPNAQIVLFKRFVAFTNSLQQLFLKTQLESSE